MPCLTVQQTDFDTAHYKKQTLYNVQPTLHSDRNTIFDSRLVFLKSKINVPMELMQVQ